MFKRDFPVTETGCSTKLLGNNSFNERQNCLLAIRNTLKLTKLAENVKPMYIGCNGCLNNTVQNARLYYYLYIN